MVAGGFDIAWLAWFDEAEPDCAVGVDAPWLETVGIDGARDGTAAVVSVVPFPCVLLGERDALVASATAPAACAAPLPPALEETWPAVARFVSEGSAASMRERIAPSTGLTRPGRPFAASTADPPGRIVTCPTIPVSAASPVTCVPDVAWPVWAEP
ncbi:MAG TPA: hypothetical protein VKF17_09615 [Isosphaeraceae bacterium]|nr:hypothetical protein [Isosphaeraceae bacterium]